MSFGRFAVIVFKIVVPLIICTGVLIFLFAAIEAKNQEGIIMLSLALLFSLGIGFWIIRDG